MPYVGGTFDRCLRYSERSSTADSSTTLSDPAISARSGLARSGDPLQRHHLITARENLLHCGPAMRPNGRRPADRRRSSSVPAPAGSTAIRLGDALVRRRAMRMFVRVRRYRRRMATEWGVTSAIPVC